MNVYVSRDVEPIKAGWASRSPTLCLAAHGHNQEVADLNLQRCIRRFLAPFERNGSLLAELTEMGLEHDDDQGELTIVLR